MTNGRSYAPPAVRAVLPYWLGVRLIAYAVAALVGEAGPHRPPAEVCWWLRVFAGYDGLFYTSIAHRGYFHQGPGIADAAFFPGYPMLIRALAWTIGLGRPSFATYYLAAVLIVGVAGFGCALLMWHWVNRWAGRRAAGIAVGLLLAGPYGFFLVASYAEAPFVACALGAWLCAERGKWAWCGLLAAAAVLTRVNGLFLLAGLAGLFVRDPSRRRQRDAWWLLLPPAGALLGWLSWQRSATGHWDGWLRAERDGWRRSTSWPWQTLARSLSRAISISHQHRFLVDFQTVADLVAAAVFVLGTVLLARRRPAEAVYVGLTAASLLTSTIYLSVARSTVLAFPLYLMAACQLAGADGAWSVRRTLLVAGVGLACVSAFGVIVTAHVHSPQIG